MAEPKRPVAQPRMALQNWVASALESQTVRRARAVLAASLEGAEAAAVPAGGGGLGGGHGELALEQQPGVQLAEAQLRGRPPAGAEAAAQVGDLDLLGAVAVAQVALGVEQLLGRGRRVR